MGKAMCYVVPFVELSVSHISILIILAITMEHYYAICQPLKSSHGLHQKKSWFNMPSLSLAKHHLFLPWLKIKL